MFQKQFRESNFEGNKAVSNFIKERGYSDLYSKMGLGYLNKETANSFLDKNKDHHNHECLEFLKTYYQLQPYYSTTKNEWYNIRFCF